MSNKEIFWDGSELVITLKFTPLIYKEYCQRNCPVLEQAGYDNMHLTYYCFAFETYLSHTELRVDDDNYIIRACRCEKCMRLPL